MIYANSIKLNKKKIIIHKRCKIRYKYLVKYLSHKFLKTYKLESNNIRIKKHLAEIFLFFLKYKIEKINLLKSYNYDNSIRLEFKVYPHYRKDNLRNNKNNLIEEISVDKFFSDNLSNIYF